MPKNCFLVNFDHFRTFRKFSKISIFFDPWPDPITTKPPQLEATRGHRRPKMTLQAPSEGQKTLFVTLRMPKSCFLMIFGHFRTFRKFSKFSIFFRPLGGIEPTTLGTGARLPWAWTTRQPRPPEKTSPKTSRATKYFFFKFSWIFWTHFLPLSDLLFPMRAVPNSNNYIFWG